MDDHYYQFCPTLSQKPKPTQQNKDIKILRTEKKNRKKYYFNIAIWMENLKNIAV